MDNELTILGLYGIVVMVTLAAQSTGALNQLGMGYLLSARDEPRKLTGITARIERALDNSIVAMVLFAPAVLIIHLRDASSGATLAAAQAFLVARILYVPLYAFGVTGLRTAVWMVGFLATLFLYLLAL